MSTRIFGACTLLVVIACTKSEPEPTPSKDRSAAAVPPIEQPTAEPPKPTTPAPPPKQVPPKQVPPVPLPPEPLPPEPIAEKLYFSEGPMPEWCKIKLEAVTAKQLDREGVCASMERSLDNCTIEESAWFSDHDHSEVGPIALLLPLGPDRFERLELAKYGYGTEEQTSLLHASVQSEQPLDASLVMEDRADFCKPRGDGEMPLCYEELIAVTRLSDGRFLVATATTDLDNPKARTGFLGARVVVAEDKADVWACDGHVQLPLPEGVPPQPVAQEPTPLPGTPTPTPTSPTPTGPTPSPEEAKAAGQRCADGWSQFGAGELAAAKLEVDAALTVLERAENEAGKRSLGACLYNRGRIAEQEGDTAAAREFYRRSLVARPNDTVQAKLDSL
jgi:hypothetical protein